MQERALKELERAKALFYSWDLNEAYNILRRYYDRLPFKAEPEHADYIAIFTRTLLELGKEFELKFYLSELESLYQKNKNAHVAFQLAVVYTDLADPKIEEAKALLERVVSENPSVALTIKAKLRLAYCFDLKDDTLNSRGIIDSIAEIPAVRIDPELYCLTEIWKAKLLRDEGKFQESEALLTAILQNLSLQKNWYAYFSANLILARLYLNTGRVEEALKLSQVLKKIFERRQFKTVARQLEVLCREVEERNKMSPLTIENTLRGAILSYENRRLELEGRLNGEKLLLMLVRKKFLPKEHIVRSAYQRPYNGPEDDALVYYQVHNLRKLLKKMGMPGEAITKDADGYRLIPEVKTLEGSMKLVLAFFLMFSLAIQSRGMLPITSEKCRGGDGPTPLNIISENFPKRPIEIPVQNNISEFLHWPGRNALVYRTKRDELYSQDLKNGQLTLLGKSTEKMSRLVDYGERVLLMENKTRYLDTKHIHEWESFQTHLPFFNHLYWHWDSMKGDVLYSLGSVFNGSTTQNIEIYSYTREMSEPTYCALPTEEGVFYYVAKGSTFPYVFLYTVTPDNNENIVSFYRVRLESGIIFHPKCEFKAFGPKVKVPGAVLGVQFFGGGKSVAVLNTNVHKSVIWANSKECYQFDFGGREAFLLGDRSPVLSTWDIDNGVQLIYLDSQESAEMFPDLKYFPISEEDLLLSEDENQLFLNFRGRGKVYLKKMR